LESLLAKYNTGAVHEEEDGFRQQTKEITRVKKKAPKQVS